MPGTTHRPLRSDDIYELRLARDAQIAPRGDRIVAVVQAPDRDTRTDRSALWLVDASSGATEQLTDNEHRDHTPRWSPDGRYVAYLSQRSSPAGPRTDLWLLDLEAGRKSIRLTSLGEVGGLPNYPLGVSLAWAPGSDRICFSATKSSDRDRSPAYIYETTRFKTGEQGWLDGRRQQLWIVSVPSGELHSLGPGPCDDVEPAWSPDGRAIAFVRTNEREGHDRLCYGELCVARTDGDRSVIRLPALGGPCFSPSFSPDGTRIAYYGHHDPRATFAEPLRLCIAAVDGHDPPQVADWDRPAGSLLMGDVHDLHAPPPPAWTGDGRAVRFPCTVGGTVNLYELAPEEGAVAPITEGDHEVVTASFTTAGDRFAVVVMTAADPGDVYVGEPRGGMSRLTDLNRELKERISFAEPSQISLTSDDGRPIDCWVLSPLAEEEATPLPPAILNLSPGPHFPFGHSFNLEHQLQAAAGYVAVTINPRGTSGYGEELLRARRPLWLGDDAEDYLAGLSQLARSGLIDERRIGVTGDAYGGTMAVWLVARDERFRAAATRRGFSSLFTAFGTSDRGGAGGQMVQHAFGGATPYSDPQLYLERSPLSHVAQIQAPVLIINSAGDPRIEVGEAEQLFVALKHHGRRARLVVYRNDTHFLSRMEEPSVRAHFFNTILEWFNELLEPSPAAGRMVADAAEEV